MKLYKFISWSSFFHYLGLVILTLGLTCTFLQANEDLGRDILQRSDIKNLDLLFNKFESDFKTAVEEKTVIGRIAVVEVDVSTLDLSTKSSKYLQDYIVKQLEKSTYRIALDLESSTEVYSPTTFISSPKLIDKETNTFKAKALLANDLEAETYANVKLSLVDEIWYLNVTLRTLPNHEVAWLSVWSQLYDDTDSWVQFNFSAGYEIDSTEILFIFDAYFFTRSYGFFEWGGNFGAGGSFFALDPIKSLNKEKTYLQFNMAPKLGFALLELTKSNYSGIDLLLSFKAGVQIIYILSSSVPINKEFDIHFILTPGLTILFGQHFLVGLDFEIMNKTLFLNFGFRF